MKKDRRDRMQEEKRQYGLLMAIAMVVGIVIGSGIFFKADDILILTDGNVALGCVVLMIGAAGIIFGGITIAEWAKVTDDTGGLISYAEKAFGKKFAFFIGWFQMIVYYPSLVAVVSWVAANYIIQLFSNFPILKEYEWLITIIFMLSLYIVNSFSTRIAGIIQTSAMFVKLIPLFVIGVLGVCFGDPSSIDISSISTGGILAGSSAIVAAAFSYDGWAIAPSICHEIKDAKRNLVIALTIAPIIILVVYMLYYLGMVFLLGPQQIIELEDYAFEAVAMKLAGPMFAKVMLTCVVISVIGSCNGIIMGSCRIPRAMALRKELPYASALEKLHPKYHVSWPSHIISLCLSFIWLGIHYVSIHASFLQDVNLDVSGLPIVIMYMFYFALYIGVIRFARQGNIQSIFLGYICPILACIGAGIVIYGGMVSKNGFMYVLISLVLLATGGMMMLYLKKKENYGK